MPPRKKTSPAAVARGARDEAEGPPPSELVEVDPRTLVIGANVRLDPIVDAEFLDSIRARGVLEPIVAYRDADDGDRLVVLRGQRRALAAVEVALSAVRVVVEPRPVEEDRLTDQLVENDHRASLATTDRVAAYEQLAAIGLTAEQIAGRTARPRSDVDAALAVAASTAARAAAAVHPLTIEQAAVVAEFDDDEAAVATLVEAAAGPRFQHAAQLLRDNRTEQATVAAALALLSEAGVPLVDRPNWNAVAKRLDQIAGDVTPEEHASCPGHAAYVEADWYGPDPDDEPEDDAQPEESGVRCDAVYVCTDPGANGHTVLKRYASPAPAARSSGSPVDDREAEAKRAERREVIENNKAWASASTVRTEWLRSFAARKANPRGAMAFVASSLAWSDYSLRNALVEGHKVAHDLLGLTATTSPAERGSAVDRALGQASEARAQVIALTIVLAAAEEGMVPDRWRVVHPAAVRYLRFIESQGYGLSHVEQRACGQKSAGKRKTAKK